MAEITNLSVITEQTVRLASNDMLIAMFDCVAKVPSPIDPRDLPDYLQLKQLVLDEIERRYIESFPPETRLCDECGGEGRVVPPGFDGYDFGLKVQMRSVCPTCPKCGGLGRITVGT